jgi:hypothetical protein
VIVGRLDSFDVDEDPQAGPELQQFLAGRCDEGVASSPAQEFAQPLANRPEVLLRRPPRDLARLEAMPEVHDLQLAL